MRTSRLKYFLMCFEVNSTFSDRKTWAFSCKLYGIIPVCHTGIYRSTFILGWSFHLTLWSEAWRWIKFVSECHRISSRLSIDGKWASLSSLSIRRALTSCRRQTSNNERNGMRSPVTDICSFLLFTVTHRNSQRFKCFPSGKFSFKFRDFALSIEVVSAVVFLSMFYECCY